MRSGGTAMRGLAVVVITLGGLAPASAAAAPPRAGTLKQLAGSTGCVTVDGSSDPGPGTCSVGRGLAGTTTVTISSDGKYAYASSVSNGVDKGSVTVFSRDTATGALAQLAGKAGCLNADGSSRSGPNTCTVVRALYDAGDGRDLVITRDGKWAYMA